MPVIRPLPLALLGIAAALAGCVTPSARPQVSQAVLDARAQRDAPPASPCPQTSLDAISPVLVGFAFDESTLRESMTRPLDEPIRWLACHRETVAAIRPDADVHGTEAEQNALARDRAEAVRAYLSLKGVPAAQIRVLPRGAPDPAGNVLLILAEGRRW